MYVWEYKKSLIVQWFPFIFGVFDLLYDRLDCDCRMKQDFQS